jgi:hypothetical protein
VQASWCGSLRAAYRGLAEVGDLVVMFATRTSVLRLSVLQPAEQSSPRGRKSILHSVRKLLEAEFIPFSSLVEAVIVLILTTLVSIALAVVVFLGAFV